MQRRRAITLTLAGLSGMSLSLVAGCARPPECTARMSDQECSDAVAKAAQEKLRKAAEEEFERQKQEALKRGEELVADGQRRAGEAVADGQSRVKQWWDDLWKSAPKPQAASKPQAPVLIPKDAAVSFAIVRQPVALDKIRWFNWYGATEYAWKDHEKPHDNQEYDETRSFHSGLDYGVDFKTPIVNCANQEGTVISVSGSPSALSYGSGPHSVVLLYQDKVMVYGHVWPRELPTVGAKIPPGERIALSGTNTTIDPDKLLESQPQGSPHLHLEVVRFSEGWKPPVGQPVTTRPGNARTNPFVFFTPELQQQINSPSLSKGPMHFPDDKRAGKTLDQPDIDPTVKGSCWEINCYN